MDKTDKNISNLLKKNEGYVRALAYKLAPFPGIGEDIAQEVFIEFIKNFRYGIAEYVRAFSKKRFLTSLQRLIPSLEECDITPSKSGVRAQAVDPKGRPVDDFKIEKRKKSIHVLNAPSPAATASLAIGEYINEIATEHFKLGEK